MSGGDIAAVIAFWKEAGPASWYEKSDDFDAEIARRFGALHERAARGEIDDWTASADGMLALLLVLDQFSRNLFRNDDPRAFAQDPHALAVAAVAIDRKVPATVADIHGPPMRQFVYMPFMHAENIACQERCVAFFMQHDDEEGQKYARIHRDIIARFGRFPHRNKALGRTTTAEEQAFLDAGGFSG